MKWYADDSGMHTEDDTKQENVLIYGGVLIDQINEDKLFHIIKDVKRQYTHEDMPIKWNMKDLRRVYERFDRISEYEQLLQKSTVWRKTIFESAEQLNYKIILSVINNFKYQKKSKKEINILKSYCFSNALMRVAIATKEFETGEKKYLVLDWPSSNDPDPYNNQYYYAYNHGKNITGQQYLTGPLKNIGFNDSIFFSKMTHSIGLQFADLCVGSFKDFLNTELDGKDFSHGKELFLIYKHKIHKFPEFLQKGIILQTGRWDDSKWNRKIKEILESI